MHFYEAKVFHVFARVTEDNECTSRDKMGWMSEEKRINLNFTDMAFPPPLSLRLTYNQNAAAQTWNSTPSPTWTPSHTHQLEHTRGHKYNGVWATDGGRPGADLSDLPSTRHAQNTASMVWFVIEISALGGVHLQCQWAAMVPRPGILSELL